MIELQNVTLQIGQVRLQNLSFRVESGRYAVIMGRTGIGKTTILEAICGLRPVQSGKILINQVDVSRWSPPDRNIGYAPQDLGLFPSLTVRGHLEFAMKIRRRRKAEIHARVNELAGLLEIAPLLERHVGGLSGGEAQRVSLGRALSFGPSVLLLDEPLSALDATTRLSTQQLLKNLNLATGVTVLHVTHNQDEANALADDCLQLQTDPVTGCVMMTQQIRPGDSVRDEQGTAAPSRE